MKRAAPAVNQVVPPDIQNGFDSPSVSNDHYITCSVQPCIPLESLNRVKAGMLPLPGGR